LFAALKRMTGALWRSAFVAFLFALHPLHVESVAWIAERKDVLCAFFWCLTLWCYARYAQRPGVGRYLLVLLGFCCGLMAKPMIVTLPFVLLLLDVWPLRRANRLAILWEKLPFFALAAAVSLVTYIAQRQGHAIQSFGYLPAGLRIANALVTYIVYIARMFWPAKLACFTPTPISCQHGARWRPASLWRASRSWHCAGFGPTLISRRMVLVSRTLVPVIGLVQVGGQSSRIGTLTCQRWTCHHAELGTRTYSSVTRAPGPWSSSRRWWPVWPASYLPRSNYDTGPTPSRCSGAQ